jgi:hypothetical protein
VIVADSVLPLLIFLQEPVTTAGTPPIRLKEYRNRLEDTVLILPRGRMPPELLEWITAHDQANRIRNRSISNQEKLPLQRIRLKGMVNHDFYRNVILYANHCGLSF